MSKSPARVLISGLCSVGKSSFVSALWGDSKLLPTAVRDCTQTNTLIRAPREGESDRQIRLAYLPRQQALEFAAGGLAYYRIAAAVQENLGLAAPKLDEMPADQRLRTALDTLKDFFAKHPRAQVLDEFLSDEIEQLEEFLRFIDSKEFVPDAFVPAKWDDRRELLMGRRGPDGRTLNVGKLWALRHVELIREPSPAWEGDAIELIDTPWIPAFHNKRRTELILEQARLADVLVILALPKKYEPEEWVLKILRERPALARRTLVVFNQIDTIDGAALFAREGFAQAFDENLDRLLKLGLIRENVFMACARLPFLQLEDGDALVAERREKLKAVLARIARLVETRPPSFFKERLLSSCDPNDAGVVSLRNCLRRMSRERFKENQLFRI